MEVAGSGEGCVQNSRAFRFVLPAACSFSGCRFSGLHLRCRLAVGFGKEDGWFLSGGLGWMGLLQFVSWAEFWR